MAHGTRTPIPWEYLALPESERDKLDELGKDGWELTAVGGDAAARILYLKRPRQSFRERVTLDQRAAYLAGLGLDDETIAGRGA